MRFPVVNFCSKSRKCFQFVRLLLCLIILACPSPGQQFLTAADFRKALDEEPVTFLTQLDFNNAQKYKDLLEVKARRRRILTQQRFYRGDIRGKAAWRRERHQKELIRRRSGRRYNGVANVVKKWPSGRIPYVLSMEYNERERAVLARAFQEYQSRTCIRFMPKTPFDHDFLYIGKIDGCYSDVGRAGGKQELSLDDGCLHVDTVIHELMHSVGFYHEHERWDRDNYLVILWQNIDKDAFDQFGRVDLVESNYYGQTYDYHSIMHYDSLAFSRNGRETLLAREPTMTAVIGSATDFSPVDLAKIHKMYQCIEPDLLVPPPPLLEFTGDNSILGPPPPFPRAAFRFPLSSPSSSSSISSPSSSFLPPSPSSPSPRFHFGPVAAGTTIHNQQQKEEGEGQNGGSKVASKLWMDKKHTAKLSVCADQLGHCPFWVSYCNAAFYGRLMRQFCALSCGLCNEKENMAVDGRSGDGENGQQKQHTFPVLVNAQRRRRR